MNKNNCAEIGFWICTFLDEFFAGDAGWDRSDRADILNWKEKNSKSKVPGPTGKPV